MWLIAAILGRTVRFFFYQDFINFIIKRILFGHLCSLAQVPKYSLSFSLKKSAMLDDNTGPQQPHWHIQAIIFTLSCGRHNRLFITSRNC